MDAEFEYEGDFESFEEKEEAMPKLSLFPPLPLIPSLVHTRIGSDVSITTENTEISSFLDIMLDESESENVNDSVGKNTEDTRITESRDEAAEEKTEPDTKKPARVSHKGIKGHPLAVSEILKESLEEPDSTNWDEVVDMRVEILRREHRRSHVDCTSHVSVVEEEKPKGKDGALGDIDCDKPDTEDLIESLDTHEDVKSVTSIISNGETIPDDIASEESNIEEPEADDGDASESDLCTEPALEYLEECTPLQVFYQPYPSDIRLPSPVPEVKIKMPQMVRLSRTVADILLRRTTLYVPPPERQGPKIWNTFQKVAEIDVEENTDVSPKKERPKGKSFLRRFITFFRKRSSKVSPASS